MRLLTWNILAMRGFKYGEAPGTNPGPSRPEIIDEMAAAINELNLDVVCLQEATNESQTQELAAQLKMQAFYCPAGWGGNDTWIGGFPGAILSHLHMNEKRDLRAKYCQTENDDCFTRHWGSAHVADLTIHCTHLTVHDPDKRMRELDILLQHCSQKNNEITKTVIMADCNFAPTSPEYSRMQENGFVDAFAHTAKQDAYALSCPSIKPRVRIDYIWLSKDIADRLRSCEILHHAPYGPREDDRLALSDHLPVLVEIEDSH